MIELPQKKRKRGPYMKGYRQRKSKVKEEAKQEITKLMPKNQLKIKAPSLYEYVFGIPKEKQKPRSRKKRKKKERKK